MSTTLRNILRTEDEYGGTSGRGRAGTHWWVALRVVEVVCADCGCVGGYLATDAHGRYSGLRGQGSDGVETSGETFLRGTQVADGEGLVEFETVLPGVVRRISISGLIPRRGIWCRCSCISRMR